MHNSIKSFRTALISSGITKGSNSGELKSLGDDAKRAANYSVKMIDRLSILNAPVSDLVELYIDALLVEITKKTNNEAPILSLVFGNPHCFLEYVYTSIPLWLEEAESANWKVQFVALNKCVNLVNAVILAAKLNIRPLNLAVRSKKKNHAEYIEEMQLRALATKLAISEAMGHFVAERISITQMLYSQSSNNQRVNLVDIFLKDPRVETFISLMRVAGPSRLPADLVDDNSRLWNAKLNLENLLSRLLTSWHTIEFTAPLWMCNPISEGFDNQITQWGITYNLGNYESFFPYVLSDEGGVFKLSCEMSDEKARMNLFKVYELFFRAYHTWLSDFKGVVEQAIAEGVLKVEMDEIILMHPLLLAQKVIHQISYDLEFGERGFTTEVHLQMQNIYSVINEYYKTDPYWCWGVSVIGENYYSTVGELTLPFFINEVSTPLHNLTIYLINDMTDVRIRNSQWPSILIEGVTMRRFVQIEAFGSDGYTLSMLGKLSVATVNDLANTNPHYHWLWKEWGLMISPLLGTDIAHVLNSGYNLNVNNEAAFLMVADIDDWDLDSSKRLHKHIHDKPKTLLLDKNFFDIITSSDFEEYNYTDVLDSYGVSLGGDEWRGRSDFLKRTDLSDLIAIMSLLYSNYTAAVSMEVRLIQQQMASQNKYIKSGLDATWSSYAFMSELVENYETIVDEDQYKKTSHALRRAKSNGINPKWSQKNKDLRTDLEDAKQQILDSHKGMKTWSIARNLRRAYQVHVAEGAPEKLPTDEVYYSGDFDRDRHSFIKSIFAGDYIQATAELIDISTNHAAELPLLIPIFPALLQNMPGISDLRDEFVNLSFKIS